eukprot:765235-Rhodomonas_salina.4
MPAGARRGHPHLPPRCHRATPHAPRVGVRRGRCWRGAGDWSRSGWGGGGADPHASSHAAAAAATATATTAPASRLRRRAATAGTSPPRGTRLAIARPPPSAAPSVLPLRPPAPRGRGVRARRCSGRRSTAATDQPRAIINGGRKRGQPMQATQGAQQDRSARLQRAERQKESESSRPGERAGRGREGAGGETSSKCTRPGAAVSSREKSASLRAESSRAKLASSLPTPSSGWCSEPIRDRRLKAAITIDSASSPSFDAAIAGTCTAPSSSPSSSLHRGRF